VIEVPEVTRQIFTPLQAAWFRIAEQLATILPKIAGFIIVVIVGWLLSKLFSFIIKKILLLIKIDVLSEKAGIEDFLRKGGLKKTLVDILGLVAYWFFLLITFIIAFDVVGLTIVSDLLNRIVLYIPNVFVALIIMMIGFYLAKLLSASVNVLAGNVGITRPDIPAKATNFIVLFFAFTMALEQLGVSKEIVTNAFIIVLGTLGLGIAIAIGLGSKDFVADLWQAYLTRQTKEEKATEETKGGEKPRQRGWLKWPPWKKE
jgi:hypothetical protein